MSNFLTVEEYKNEVCTKRKANCLAYALNITQFEYIPDLNWGLPIKDAFKQECLKHNISIKKDILSYDEVINTDGYIIVVWGFFPIRTLWGIQKSDFHVARRRPDGVWEHIQEIGGYPKETTWEELIVEYPEHPWFFQVEKC